MALSVVDIMRKLLYFSFLCLAVQVLPAELLAEETEASETQPGTAEEQRQAEAPEADSETQEDMENTEENEDSSLAADIIPSEMISEDLAVDFPIDI